MGKIFDALEKSRKETSISDSLPERSDTGIKNPAHLKEVSFNDPLPVNEYNQLDKNLVALFKPQSFEAEQFKILKTSLLFPTTGKPPKVIMVSSAVPGEGKSFVAANLAISLAQNIDEHVLLMDCDLRIPTVHTRFGFGETSGLSDYLSGRTSLSSLFLKSKVDKLTILPAGKPPHNPSELLSSDRMLQLIDEVKSRYSDRYIIIDTAPPQLTAESTALAKQVDGVLLVINYGKTKREVIDELVNSFGKEKILGIILNRFSLQSSSYFKYGKYDKYSKYYGRK